MMMRLTAVCCVLLPLLAHSAQVAHSNRYNFAPSPSPYCRAPWKDSQGKEVVPSDLHEVCKKQSEEERDKLTHAYNVLLKHVEGIQSGTGPLSTATFEYLGATGSQLISQPTGYFAKRIHEMRRQALIAAIETDRLHTATALYITTGSWGDWRFVVDRITKSPRRHRYHIQNLIRFISMLPDRQEQLEYFRYLRDRLVEHKEHESYLGGLFAQRAGRVVFAEDGKSAENKTDEHLLWTTMFDASVGYFKRSLLAGKNIMDWYLMDVFFYEVLEMLLPNITDVSKEDLRHLDTMRMIGLPCHMHRPHTKVLMFREIIKLLQKHFTWENQNFMYAPKIAYEYKGCELYFGKGNMSTILKKETMELFKQFHPKQTYATLIKTREKGLARTAG